LHELAKKSQFLQTKDVTQLSNTLLAISLYKYSSLKGAMCILVQKHKQFGKLSPKKVTPKLSIHVNTRAEVPITSPFVFKKIKC
jgi:hypothetical protein